MLAAKILGTCLLISLAGNGWQFWRAQAAELETAKLEVATAEANRESYLLADKARTRIDYATDKRIADLRAVAARDRSLVGRLRNSAAAIQADSRTSCNFDDLRASRELAELVAEGGELVAEGREVAGKLGAQVLGLQAVVREMCLQAASVEAP